jgi:predicted transcriptional regulator
MTESYVPQPVGLRENSPYVAKTYLLPDEQINALKALSILDVVVLGDELRGAVNRAVDTWRSPGLPDSSQLYDPEASQEAQRSRRRGSSQEVTIKWSSAMNEDLESLAERFKVDESAVVRSAIGGYIEERRADPNLTAKVEAARKQIDRL